MPLNGKMESKAKKLGRFTYYQRHRWAMLRIGTLVLGLALLALLAASIAITGAGAGSAPVLMAMWTVTAGLGLMFSALLGSACWIAGESVLHPKPCEGIPSLVDYPVLESAAETVSFEVPGAGRRVGYFIRGRSRATVLLLHGFGCRRQQMLIYADFLNRAGYSTLLFDFRHMGDSEGDQVTLGHYEQEDVMAAVRYLGTRPDAEVGRLGVLGVSMGAAVAILAAAKLPQIKAVIADSPYESAAKVVEEGFTRVTGLPAFPCAPITVQIIRWRLRISEGDIAPKNQIAAISPRPVLLIHGMADSLPSPSNSETLFAAARDPKELWLLEGSRHVAGIIDYPEEYCRRVVGFFDTHLGTNISEESAEVHRDTVGTS